MDILSKYSNCLAKTWFFNDDRQKLRECGLKGKVVVTLVLKSVDVDMHIETLRAKGIMREEDDIKMDVFLSEPSLLELDPR